ncbi:MAG: InlB B-repeat-containing protein [Candidatus Methanomethylophilaceae archaeon]|nr:InlB B-repeat-containing protein [Candidatus Methanomethylophilaceae archaeon]
MNKTILAAVVLIAAAFAGVMIVGDDTDALATSIEYKVGDESTVRTFGAEATTFVAPTPSELGFDTDKDFLNWIVDGGSAIYRAGMEYAIPDNKITLVAQFDRSIYVTLVIGDESFKCVVGDDKKIDLTTPECKAADEALKAIDTSKFRTEGFFAKDAEDPTNITGEFTESVVLTQKIVPYFKISFVVEGATISTVDSDRIILNDAGDDKRNVPVAPSKENYAFAGWFGKQGAEVISFSIDKDEYTYFAGDKFEFTEDTVLYAKFVPANMTVTFQIGEETVTQTVLYGAKAMKPELPAGYVAWMYDGKEFDFNTPITAEITIVALEAAPIEPTTVYDITFEIADKTPVVQKSDSMVIPDTTLEGYIFQGWVVKNGAQYVDPVEYVKTITENVTFVAVYKLATESAFTVTFEIEGKSPITQKADSLTIPDTTREGYDFTGWVVKGSSDYVDPMTYVITADITFVAVYKAVEVVEYIVTFVNGDDVVAEVKVIAGQIITEVPEAPEGMFWLFNKDAAITADVTIEAKPMTVTVQFAVGEKVYNAYTQVIAYGEKIDVTKLTDFIFPDGYDSWNYDFNEPVTADMTVYAKAIPEPEKEPKFWQTPMGQCAIIIAIFIGGLFFFGVFTGRIELPKFKVSRVGKDEVVEQIQEEKKP